MRNKKKVRRHYEGRQHEASKGGGTKQDTVKQRVTRQVKRGQGDSRVRR